MSPLVWSTNSQEGGDCRAAVTFQQSHGRKHFLPGKLYLDAPMAMKINCQTGPSLLCFRIYLSKNGQANATCLLKVRSAMTCVLGWCWSQDEQV